MNFALSTTLAKDGLRVTGVCLLPDKPFQYRIYPIDAALELDHPQDSTQVRLIGGTIFVKGLYTMSSAW